MKKTLFQTLLFCLLLSCSKVNASTCSYKEQADLNSEVSKIKVKYEEKTGFVDPSLYDCQEDAECTSEYNYFQISILNMSENFYVEVNDSVTKTTNIYTYADAKEGVISFDFEGAYAIANFTFKVFSSSQTNCPRENYRVIYLTTPKINPYYNYLQCENNPDHYLCQKYITVDNVSFAEFQRQIQEYEDKKIVEEKQNEKKGMLEKIFDFIDDNKTIIVTTAGIIVAGVVTVVVIKKRKKEL